MQQPGVANIQQQKWDLCGHLTKRHHVIFHDFYLGLRGQYLYVFRSEEDPIPKHIIDLYGAEVQSQMGSCSPLVFSLRGPGIRDGKTYLFRASTAEDKVQWCDALSHGITQARPPERDPPILFSGSPKIKDKKDERWSSRKSLDSISPSSVDSSETGSTSSFCVRGAASTLASIGSTRVTTTAAAHRQLSLNIAPSESLSATSSQSSNDTLDAPHRRSTDNVAVMFC
jgi:hypothetical protein